MIECDVCCFKILDKEMREERMPRAGHWDTPTESKKEGATKDYHHPSLRQNFQLFYRTSGDYVHESMTGLP